MLSSACPADARRMIRSDDEYWDADRASYEDELDAWRERIAAPVAPVAPASIASVWMPRVAASRARRPSRSDSAKRVPVTFLPRVERSRVRRPRRALIAERIA
jgi:hypothetical protein